MRVVKKQNQLIKERLENVMLQDRRPGLETLLAVVKSEVSMLLSNYMSLSEGSNAVEIVLDAFESGDYQFTIKARADRLFDAGKMLVW